MFKIENRRYGGWEVWMNDRLFYILTTEDNQFAVINPHCLSASAAMAFPSVLSAARYIRVTTK
jgi:hypothetical protein